jgi:hypothetical protein
MSHRRPDAIVTGVTSSDDNHVLASGVDKITVLKLGIHQGSRVQLKIFHCKMNTPGTSVGNLKVSGPGSSCGQNQCVVFRSNRFHLDVHTDISVGNVGLISISTMNRMRPPDVPLLRQP